MALRNDYCIQLIGVTENPLWLVLELAHGGALKRCVALCCRSLATTKAQAPSHLLQLQEQQQHLTLSGLLGAARRIVSALSYLEQQR